MQVEEEERRDSADLPPEDVPCAHPSAAGIALALHRPADHTRTSLSLMKMVQRGRDARQTPVVGVGPVARQSLGVLEEGGEVEQGLILVHFLLLPFRFPPGVGGRALHQRLLGGSVVADYANGQERDAGRRFGPCIRTGC